MMKGFLALIMTISHFTGVSSYCINNSLVKLFNVYTNLTTFSGFLFCFGYVCWNRYIDCEQVDGRRLIKGFLKAIIAFYISGIAYVLLFDGTLLDAFSVIMLQKVPSVSEFLLGFILFINKRTTGYAGVGYR